MKIFLDSNVLVDWIPARETGSFEEASKILDACELKKMEGFISPRTVYLLAFVLKKSGMKKKETSTWVQKLLEILSVIPMGNKEFASGICYYMDDMEDSFQLSFAASMNDIFIFITSNIRDFPKNKCQMKILHPVKFLEQYL